MAGLAGGLQAAEAALGAVLALGLPIAGVPHWLLSLPLACQFLERLWLDLLVNSRLLWLHWVLSLPCQLVGCMWLDLLVNSRLSLPLPLPCQLLECLGWACQSDCWALGFLTLQGQASSV